mmetsp:Transcript_23595/g.49112  ORF Transcript_23595/g.49112 Transcript_23595/m.49112 type:complete len:126 (-) Transcript_23595:207-584(-)
MRGFDAGRLFMAYTLATPAAVRGEASPYTVSVGRAMRESEWRRDKRVGRVLSFKGIIVGPSKGGEGVDDDDDDDGGEVEEKRRNEETREEVGRCEGTRRKSIIMRLTNSMCICRIITPQKTHGKS